MGCPPVPLVSTVLMLPRPTLETLLQRSCKLIWPETVKIIKVKYLTLKYWLRKCSSFPFFGQILCSKKPFTFSLKSIKLRIFLCLFWLKLTPWSIFQDSILTQGTFRIHQGNFRISFESNPRERWFDHLKPFYFKASPLIFRKLHSSKKDCSQCKPQWSDEISKWSKLII